VNIKPSASIRKNYNEISALCKTTKEPVFLTKNGEGDLVVMDMDTFSRRESMLKLREQLVAVEEDRLIGKKGFSIDEMDEMMKKAIKESVNDQRI
jgi:PHD/YefM family antitoxin component YafN of YafNO toxin-antitoxin module